jgi:hypothetical protein
MGNIPNKIGHYRDGLYRRKVHTLSTDNHTLSFEQSGTLFFVPTATTCVIKLPRISSKWLGVEYEFFIQEQASSNDVKINCSLDSSAIIQTNFSSVVDNHSTIIPGSTFATFGRLTAVSSIVWMLTPGANSYSMSSAATDNLAGWTTG